MKRSFDVVKEVDDYCERESKPDGSDKLYTAKEIITHFKLNLDETCIVGTV
jgi:hypothetical protein